MNNSKAFHNIRLYPGAAKRSDGRYHPVIRITVDGKMNGSKRGQYHSASQTTARMMALLAAQEAAIGHSSDIVRFEIVIPERKS